ncbi:MAG: ABC transporter permease [Lachnospiraceae bacterium]|nr:ABC transporter permease [Lachnospiraceae bacterium]
MNIILKTTLKNTFGKPLRSILVIFSIFVCTFAALFCFDLAQTEKGLVGYMFSSMSGEADIMAYSYTAELSALPEGFPESQTLVVRSFGNPVYVDVPDTYYLVTSDTFTIYGVDAHLAASMGYIKDVIPGDMEIVLTDRYMNDFGIEVGDTISVYDKAGDPVELTVVGMARDDVKNLLFRGYSGAVNNATADILSCGKTVGGAFMINVLDDTQIDAAEEMLKEKFKSENVQRFALTDDMEDMMNELFGLLFILFAVAFLLVIFITFSICERIVSDRMSYIGTLRSLGMSPRGTAGILLLENVMYALLGSVPGVLLYLAIRGPMMSVLFDVSTATGMVIELEIPSISKALVIGTILGAIAIECLIPLKAVLKALKMSIRDIIFDNRDTEYKFNRSGIITGCIMTIVALIAALIPGGLFSAAICLIAAVMAVAFLFPVILKAVTNGVFSLSERFGKEKMSLASRESISRKSTVGSGVLCATSVTMCVLVYIIATSMNGMLVSDLYDCDVVVTVAETGMPKHFSFVEHLDGVTETEYIYQKLDYIYLEDVEYEKTAQFFGIPEGGYDMFHALYDLPDVIEDGTIYIEKNWAKNNGYSIGDPLTITFHPSGVFPVREVYTVAGFFKVENYEAMKNNFAISESDFISIYHDEPGYLMVRSDDPEKTRDEIKRYAINYCAESKTVQDIVDDFNEDNAQSERVLGVIIAVAVIMTCIGMISNQIIGFEGRKKECAVMISTSMSRKTLSGILFREMLITSFAASTFGVAVSTLLIVVLKRAFDMAENIYLIIDINPGVILKLWVLMTIVFTLTVLFPIRNLKKMKLSEQLKYE